jgi:alkyl hydroperoxide reductase subunit AhpC
VSPVYNELIPISLGIFLIDIDKRIRTSMRYSPTTGRNFYEALRLFDGLQLVTKHKIVVPCNWGIGQDVMLNNDVPPEQQESFR